MQTQVAVGSVDAGERGDPRPRVKLLNRIRYIFQLHKSSRLYSEWCAGKAGAERAVTVAARFPRMALPGWVIDDSLARRAGGKGSAASVFPGHLASIITTMSAERFVLN